MGIVVDTNIFINAENGRYDIEELNNFSGYGEVYISAVTFSELCLGVHLAPDTVSKVRREAFVESIINTVPVLSFSGEVARMYARIYALFLKPCNQPGSNVHDLQIAATALTYGYPVLTCNTGDFDKVPGLKLLVP